MLGALRGRHTCSHFPPAETLILNQLDSINEQTNTERCLIFPKNTCPHIALYFPNSLSE